MGKFLIFYILYMGGTYIRVSGITEIFKEFGWNILEQIILHNDGIKLLKANTNNVCSKHALLCIL